MGGPRSMGEPEKIRLVGYCLDEKSSKEDTSWEMYKPRWGNIKLYTGIAGTKFRTGFMTQYDHMTEVGNGAINISRYAE
jgi:hypothetical protein